MRVLLFVFMCIVCSPALGGGMGAVPIAHWAFDHDDDQSVAGDDTGGGLDAIVSGATRSPGVRGLALECSGDGQYADVPAGTGVLQALGELNQGGFSLWFRFDSRPPDNQIHPLFYLGSGLPGQENTSVIAEIGHIDSVQYLYFTVLKGYDGGQSHIPLCFRTADDLEAGVWHHFAISVSPDGNTGWLDGAVLSDERYNVHGDETATAFCDDLFVRNVFWMGRGYLASVQADQFLDGALDEIMVFEEPMNDEQVLGHYQEIALSASMAITSHVHGGYVAGQLELSGTADNIGSLQLEINGGDPIQIDRALQWSIPIELSLHPTGPVQLQVQMESNFGLEIVETIEVINADITRDSRVDIQDLLALIDRWGSSDADGDLNGDGTVAIGDLLIVLSAFGL
jgi:hypothetical protein